MIVLVINSGSSSLKFQLLDMSNEAVLSKGQVERIGGSALFTVQSNGNKTKSEVAAKNHQEAVQVVVDSLVEGDHAVLKSLDEIGAIGQRVVQGGESITEATIINDDVIDKIEEYSELAPLHNPPALAAIRACAAVMPRVKQVGVFDTSFHHTMDQAHYMYAIPYEDYEKYHVRRYGAHGTSHKYVAHRAAELVGKPIEDLKIISCHLGNGASVTAVKYGKVVNTSMGFTPLEGVVMGTRSGNIDAAAVLYLMEKKGYDTNQMDQYLNKESGLLGISGLSNDFRDIEEAMECDDKRAQLAYDMFVLSVRGYIGMYMAEMDGADILIFTAGIGENDDLVRASICDGMQFLGLAIDPVRNKGNREESELTANHSFVRTWLIPTNEELAIARETVEALKK